MCLFTKSSLGGACKAFDVPPEFCKGEFEHAKIFSFASAEIHREEVTDYLKHDVTALAYLMKNYQQTMFGEFKKDPLRCMTPSQFAVRVWQSMTPDITRVRITDAGKDEEVDRAAYYGGSSLFKTLSYGVLSHVQ